MPFTSTLIARTLTLNLTSDSEYLCFNAQRRFELEDRVDKEQVKKGEEEEQADETLLKALRRMGIRARKQFDLKWDKTFESQLERTEFHLVVNKSPEEDKASWLLLLIEVNLFEAARHLNIKSNTPYFGANQKIKDYYAVTETKEELRKKLN